MIEFILDKVMLCKKSSLSFPIFDKHQHFLLAPPRWPYEIQQGL